MDRTETIKILATLSAAYPQIYSKIEDGVKGKMINIWQSFFENDDYGIVGKALINYISNDITGYLPPIGAIKEEIRKIKYPDDPTEQEAVNTILERLSWKSSKEAYDSLPPVLQKVVGSPRQLSVWGNMDIDTIQSVIASNIGRSLRVLLDKERQSQRTGQYIPAANEQLEKPQKAKQLIQTKTDEEIDSEKKEILKTIAKAKRRVANAQVER